MDSLFLLPMFVCPVRSKLTVQRWKYILTPRQSDRTCQPSLSAPIRGWTSQTPTSTEKVSSPDADAKTCAVHTVQPLKSEILSLSWKISTLMCDQNGDFVSSHLIKFMWRMWSTELSSQQEQRRRGLFSITPWRGSRMVHPQLHHNWSCDLKRWVTEAVLLPVLSQCKSLLSDLFEPYLRSSFEQATLIQDVQHK